MTTPAAPRRYPQRDDARCRNGLLFPDWHPKFSVRFDGSTTVFAIGSCFARNIEYVLEASGVRVPTSVLPPETRGVINEYTPGCIQQRILSALGGGALSDETIVPQVRGYMDLLLVSSTPVALERAEERRKEISAIYSELASSDLVVITLGHVESWYDQETQLFLNRHPPRTVTKAAPNRYTFKRLGIDDSLKLLQPAIDVMTAKGLKVLITVSPVPMASTRSGDDCITANEFSKSVLRICAEHLSRDNPNVDYFPSYEIVRSGGLSSYSGPGHYIEDYRHVHPDIVARVTQHMISGYAKFGGDFAPCASAKSA